MSPSLTIISISRDDPQGLEATLTSIAAQTLKPASVIVVRRGLSCAVDLGGFDIAGLREAADPATGISAAFNAGIAAATDDWLMFLNGGDTLLDAGSLQRLGDACAAVPDSSDIVAGFAITEHGDTIPHRMPATATDFLYLSHQAAAFRRRAFDEVGRYDTSFSIRMDLDWLARYVVLKGNAHIVFVNQPFVCYRMDGISSRSIKTFYTEELRVLARHPRFLARLLQLVLRDMPARALSPRSWRARLSRHSSDRRGPAG